MGVPKSLQVVYRRSPLDTRPDFTVKVGRVAICQISYWGWLVPLGAPAGTVPHILPDRLALGASDLLVTMSKRHGLPGSEHANGLEMVRP